MSTSRVESKSVDEIGLEVMSLSVAKSFSNSRHVEIDTQKFSTIDLAKEESNVNENKILMDIDSPILKEIEDNVSDTKGNSL